MSVMFADTVPDEGMALVDVPSSEPKRAVIVGGGFAGLAAARRCAKPKPRSS